MHITIPEPCHENWGEMTPTQRGAFCQKCAVDVIDFSGKSAHEIKATLDAHIGKHLCGRFEKKQLQTLNQDCALWEKQTAQTFQSKFLWACLIVFGMTLFTGCETSTAQQFQTNLITQAELHEADTNRIASDTTVHESITPIDLEEYPWDFIQGDIAYDPSWDKPESQTDSTDHLEIPIDSLDKPSSCTSILPDRADTQTKPDHPEEMLLGKIALPIKKENDPIGQPELTEENIPRIQTSLYNARVFPNPTHDTATLSITPEKRGKYVISVYAANGKLVQMLYNGLLNPEEQNFRIQLSNQRAGLYFIQITSDIGTKTLKINKVD